MSSVKTPNNPLCMFMVHGMPFAFPTAWVQSEQRTTFNSVNSVDNPQYVPAISMTGNGISITVQVPRPHNKVLLTSIKLLKVALTRNAELWASEKYKHVDLTSHRPPVKNELGIEVTPNPVQGWFTPFGNIKLPWYLPMLSGYIGVENYMLAGFMDNFSSSFSPHTLLDTWVISMQGINISALTSDAPNPDAPPTAETPPGPGLNPYGGTMKNYAGV